MWVARPWGLRFHSLATDGRSLNVTRFTTIIIQAVEKQEQNWLSGRLMFIAGIGRRRKLL